MKIYPAIDLKDGKCVRLVQGDYNEVTVYSHSPAKMAKEWERQGASYLHLVDLDGAKAGKSINSEAIETIIKTVHIPVQLGGGIRSLEDIQAKLDLGVTRVILGSIAAKEPELVREAIQIWGPDRIVVGIDAKSGRVAINGWLEVTPKSSITLARELKVLGVQTIIYTDIAKDGMMQGINVSETQKMIEATGLQIIASGGVSKLSDLDPIKKIGSEGVIIGKALYTGKLDLREAICSYEGGLSC